MKRLKMTLAVGLFAAGLWSAPVMAKKQPALSGLALQQIQSHDFEASKDVVFSAVMTVLQDAGYRIQAGDKATGLITGVGTSDSHTTWVPFVGFGKTKLVPAVSAYIEEMGPSITRVRLDFVMSKIKSNLYHTGLGDEKAVEDPSVYQDAFEKIGQGVFLRQSMASKPSAAVTLTPVAATPPAQPDAPVAPTAAK